MICFLVIAATLCQAQDTPASRCASAPARSITVPAALLKTAPISVSWVHDCVNQATQIVVEGVSSGWLGVGFVEKAKVNPPFKMSSGEFYQFSFDSAGKPVAANGYGKDNEMPMRDVESFVGATQVIRNGTVIKASFGRKWTASSVSFAVQIGMGARQCGCENKWTVAKGFLLKK